MTKFLRLGERVARMTAVAMLFLSGCVSLSAAQVEKTIGKIFDQVQAQRNGSDGDYGYQMYKRDCGISAVGCSKENLVLEMDFYIENLDEPGNLEIMNTATFNQIEVGNELANGSTWINWPIKGLSDADGNPVKAGVWNKLRLEFSASRGGGSMDLSQPLNYFRWCLAHIHEPQIPEAYLIRLKNVKIIDKSQLVEEEGTDSEYTNTEYLAAELPFTMNAAIVGTDSRGISIGKTFEAVNVADHDPRMLSLQFDAEITEGTPGDLGVLKTVPGQIELTSSGRPDNQELCFPVATPDWKTGKHTYTLAFPTGTFSGGAPDYSALNYMRIYAVNIPATVDRLTMKVDNVKIIDRTTATTLPAFFSSGMMFQQKKPINIWGYSAAGREVKVRFYRENTLIEEKVAVADAAARWNVSFGALDGGYDKYKFEVEENGTVIQTVDDILIGELWIAGGQSNMALTVGSTQQKDELMNGADNDNIRFLCMPTFPYSGNGNGEMPATPTKDILGAYWGHGNNGVQVGGVSAVAYIAIKEIQEKLDIPVGFINSAVGGSVIEAWLTRAELDENTSLVNALNRYGLYYDESFWVNQSTTVTALYNQKVGPLAGLNIAGVLWYQGESNSGRPELYADELKTMKLGWENAFNFEPGTMPFVFCQVARWVVETDKPQYLAAIDEAMFDAWNMSESSRETMSLLPIYDTDMSYVGNVVIHPTNKMPVGKRFATAMYNLVYASDDAEYTAPYMESVTPQTDGSLIVKFAHVGNGLYTLDGVEQVRGFAVCDERGVYVNADARIISKDEVKVWSNSIKTATDVTYAYATYNFYANLGGGDGFAAVPFRSNRNADQVKYFNPQDWAYADASQAWGILNKDAAGWFDTWQASNATISFDEAVKYAGTASLRIDYSVANSGDITFAPNVEPLSVVPQIGNFKYVYAWVKNNDARSKSLSLNIKQAATVTATSSVAELAQNEQWQLVVFDLNDIDATTLSNATTLEFVVVDTPTDGATEGSILVDDISFGLDMPQASGIDNILVDATDEVTSNDPYYYDLVGRRYLRPAGIGVYIHNGKKMVVIQ